MCCYLQICRGFFFFVFILPVYILGESVYQTRGLEMKMLIYYGTFNNNKKRAFAKLTGESVCGGGGGGTSEIREGDEMRGQLD